MTRRMLVSVVGDAGVGEDSLAYSTARLVGRLLVDSGFRVVTGGLGGVMEAASRGAHESSGYREGDTIGLIPSDDPNTANPWVDIVVRTDLGFGRNQLVARSDALIAVGGGAGTLSEIAFGWMHKRPIVALTLEGWSGRLAGQRLDHRNQLPQNGADRILEAATAEDGVNLVRSHLASQR